MTVILIFTIIAGVSFAGIAALVALRYRGMKKGDARDVSGTPDSHHEIENIFLPLLRRLSFLKPKQESIRRVKDVSLLVGKHLFEKTKKAIPRAKKKIKELKDLVEGRGKLALNRGDASAFLRRIGTSSFGETLPQKIKRIRRPRKSAAEVVTPQNEE